jgi:O-antigen ligase
LVVVAGSLGLLAGADPGMAVTAALTVGFAVVAFSNLTAGLALYVFISFFALHPHGLYDSLARIVLGLAWFAVIATDSRQTLSALGRHPLALSALALFLGWAGLSVVWSESPGTALSSVGDYGASALLFLIAATAVRSWSGLAWIAAAFVLGALGAAASGVPSLGDGDEVRLSSTLLDPNALGANLLAAAALAGCLFALVRSEPARALWLTAGALCLVAVLLTGSRGTLVALVVTLACAVALIPGRRLQVAAVGTAVLATSVVFFAAFAPDELSERLSETSRGEERIQEGRTTIWQVAWRGFEAHPIEGLGTGNFRVSSKRYVFEPGLLARTDEVIEEPEVIHNSHLEILTELGLVGLALFGTLVVACLATMLRAARLLRRAGDGRRSAAVAFVALAAIGFLAAIVFFSDQYGKPLWLLLGLGPAVLALARATEPSDSAQVADYTR